MLRARNQQGGGFHLFWDSPFYYWVTSKHVENHVALKRAARCLDGNESCGRSSGNHGFYESAGNDGEACGAALKRDARRALEAFTNDSDRLSYFACRLRKFHERTKTGREAENCAPSVVSAGVGQPVEIPVRRLHQMILALIRRYKRKRAA